MRISFRLTAACLALIGAAFIAGCGGGGGGGGGTPTTGDTTAPVFTSASLSTSYLYDTGGTVTINAYVYDDTAVSQVKATVTPVGGKGTTVTLMGDGTYSGQFTAPANTGSDSLTYNVTITAKDAAGNSTNYTGLSFYVLGTNSPPPPPY